jgi:hypothetical protein
MQQKQKLWLKVQNDFQNEMAGEAIIAAIKRLILIWLVIAT